MYKKKTNYFTVELEIKYKFNLVSIYDKIIYF